MKQPKKTLAGSAAAVLLALLTGVLCACGSGDTGNSGNTPQNYQAIDRATLAALDQQFTPLFADDVLAQARCADTADYLTQVEKEVFYYLNLARLSPKVFAQTYAQAYTGDTGYSKQYAWDERKQSLASQLLQTEPMPALKPSEGLFELADCFATKGGQQGRVYHDREGLGCEGPVEFAECCDYWACYSGYAQVMHFLIDAGENNARLGHRTICLNPQLEYMGVAVRPHATYQSMAVLDFWFEEL